MQGNIIFTGGGDWFFQKNVSHLETCNFAFCTNNNNTENPQKSFIYVYLTIVFLGKKKI